MNANAIVTFAPKDVWMMAEKIAASRLFGMKSAEEAFSLMMIAQAEGLHPAIAARDFHVIQGRPALKADAMMARFQAAGGKVEWHDLSDVKVCATFSHPAGGSARIEWTIEMARKIGLAGKDNWKNYPRAMLRARVVSEGVRTVFPGCVVGVYTPEEVQDFDTKEVVKQADVREVAANAPVAPGSQEWQDMGDGFDRAQSTPKDRDILIGFNGKGKPPTRKAASSCTVDELAKAVELARKRFKDAKGEYAEKNKAEAQADGEAAKEWAAFRAAQETGSAPASSAPPAPDVKLEPAAAPEPAAPEAGVNGDAPASTGPSYGDKLSVLIEESEHETTRRAAEAAKIDYTALVDAVNDRRVLSDVELTKLEAVGVNVKGLK